MKKFLKGTCASLGLLGVLAAGAAAQQPQPAPQDEAGRGGNREGMRRGGRGGHEFRGLNLTDAQREQIRTLREGLRQRTQAQRDELRQLFQARRQGGQLTPEQAGRAGQLQEELRQAHDAHRQQMLAVLTPEQRTRLEQRKQMRRRRLEERRQRRDEFRRQRQPTADTL